MEEGEEERETTEGGRHRGGGRRTRCRRRRRCWGTRRSLRRRRHARRGRCCEEQGAGEQEEEDADGAVAAAPDDVLMKGQRSTGRRKKGRRGAAVCAGPHSGRDRLASERTGEAGAVGIEESEGGRKGRGVEGWARLCGRRAVGFLNWKYRRARLARLLFSFCLSFCLVERPCLNTRDDGECFTNKSRTKRKSVREERAGRGGGRERGWMGGETKHTLRACTFPQPGTAAKPLRLETQRSVRHSACACSTAVVAGSKQRTCTPAEPMAAERSTMSHGEHSNSAAQYN